MRGTPGSACPQPEPNATELPSSAPGRPKLIEPQANRHDAVLWTRRPPRLRQRRHAEHLAGLQIVRLRALARRRAPSPASARRIELRTSPAADLAALPNKASHIAGLQISPRFAPSYTPTCTEENLTTRPPLDHSDARGGAPCRDAGLQTSRPRRPLAHADARGGTLRRDAGLKTSRPRRQSARKMSRKPPLGLPHQQRVSNVQRAYEGTVRVGLKGCARDQTCASWFSRLPALRLNDRRWGLALVLMS